LRKLDRRQQPKRGGHCGHFGIANLAQIFVDIACDRLVGVQKPEGRGLIGAHIMHRLEHVRRGIGDDGDTVRQLQAVPGIPGAERKSDHHAERHDEDDGLQQRGYGETVQHGGPQDFSH